MRKAVHCIKVFVPLATKFEKPHLINEFSNLGRKSSDLTHMTVYECTSGSGPRPLLGWMSDILIVVISASHNLCRIYTPCLRFLLSSSPLSTPRLVHSHVPLCDHYQNVVRLCSAALNYRQFPPRQSGLSEG